MNLSYSAPRLVKKKGTKWVIQNAPVLSRLAKRWKMQECQCRRDQSMLEIKGKEWQELSHPKNLDQKIAVKATLSFVLKPVSVARCREVRSCHRNSLGVISLLLSRLWYWTNEIVKKKSVWLIIVKLAYYTPSRSAWSGQCPAESSTECCPRWNSWEHVPAQGLHSRTRCCFGVKQPIVRGALEQQLGFSRCKRCEMPVSWLMLIHALRIMFLKVVSLKWEVMKFLLNYRLLGAVLNNQLHCAIACFVMLRIYSCLSTRKEGGVG